MVKRFEYSKCFEEITDKVTGKNYGVYDFICGDVTDLLNQLSERGDKIIESYTTKDLLKLRFQKDIYERFSKETMDLLKKYCLDSLDDVDKILSVILGNPTPLDKYDAFKRLEEFNMRLQIIDNCIKIMDSKR